MAGGFKFTLKMGLKMSLQAFLDVGFELAMVAAK